MERLAVVTSCTFNEEYVTSGLAARNWRYSFARDSGGVISQLFEFEPEALCILSLDLLKCDDTTIGGLLRKSIDIGVARVAVVTNKREQSLMVWSAMNAQHSHTELRSFSQLKYAGELNILLDFVTGGG